MWCACIHVDLLFDKPIALRSSTNILQRKTDNLALSIKFAIF